MAPPFITPPFMATPFTAPCFYRTLLHVTPSQHPLHGNPPKWDPFSVTPLHATTPLHGTTPCEQNDRHVKILPCPKLRLRAEKIKEMFNDYSITETIPLINHELQIHNQITKFLSRTMIFNPQIIFTRKSNDFWSYFIGTNEILNKNFRIW